MEILFHKKKAEAKKIKMKSLRTKRDEQQWMLDLALNMRESPILNEMIETPKRAHNYRMLPKMWNKKQNMMSFSKTS